MGEMLAETELNSGTKGQLKGKDSSGVYRQTPPESKAPTLADLGITKHESARAQKLAALPGCRAAPSRAVLRRFRFSDSLRLCKPEKLDSAASIPFFPVGLGSNAMFHQV